jgi:sulfur transfer complex TusBCD TusB component (DsrH family)
LKTLHILRKRKDAFAEAAICSEATSEGKGRNVTVLLIQDAVLGSPAVPVPIYVNIQDLQARGVQREYPAIHYDRICQMIIDHDRTIVW